MSHTLPIDHFVIDCSLALMAGMLLAARKQRLRRSLKVNKPLYEVLPYEK